MYRLVVLVGVAACGFQPLAAPATDDAHVDVAFHDAPDAPPIPLFSKRINIAGVAYTGVDNPGMWIADPGVCTGNVFASSVTTISGTNDSTLYVDEEYAASLPCAVPGVPAGAYHVTLLFAEIYFGAPCSGTVSDRVFSIALEGATVMASFDEGVEGGGCAVTGGPGHPINKSFDLRIDDGELDVVLTSITGNYATVSALELVQTGP